MDRLVKVRDALKNVHDVPEKRVKVIVVGGGCSGLLSLRYLKGFDCEMVLFEGKEEIGGQWKFDGHNEFTHPNLTKDVFYQHYGCLQTSMYEDLTTNIPKQFMTFRDFPHAPDVNCFMSQKYFFTYLLRFVEHFGLRPYIRTNTFVEKVRLTAQHDFSREEVSALAGQRRRKFFVQTCNSVDQSVKQYHYADYVIVANGHQSVPFIPSVKGEDTFTGLKLHTHHYRQYFDSMFDNKTIMIYGGANSAVDIKYFIAKKRMINYKRIYMVGPVKWLEKSTDYADEYASGKIVLINSRVKEIRGSTLIMENGQSAEGVDVMIYATGYRFKFPFLDNDPRGNQFLDVMPEDLEHRVIGPLYRRIFCCKEPDLMFIGLQEYKHHMMIVFERQARIAAAYVRGEVKLPSQEDMLKDSEEEKNKHLQSGLPMHKFFKYGCPQYFTQLREMVNLPFCPKYENDLNKYAQVYCKCFDVDANFVSAKKIDFKQYISPDFNPTSQHF